MNRPGAMHRGLVAASFALLPLAMLAAPVAADFGYANSQCSRWLDPELAGEEMARRQWVLGYLTAFNRYGGKEITNTDPNVLMEKLREHCAAHPTDSLETAAEAMLTEIPH